MVYNTEPVIVNHGLLCSPKGYESWRVILGKVVVNHGVLCGASGCDSWCVIPNQWLLIMVCYADPVDVNHVLLCCPKGCESWCVILWQRL